MGISNAVILSPSFGRRISRDVPVLNALSRLFHQKHRVRGERAAKRQVSPMYFGRSFSQRRASGWQDSWHTLRQSDWCWAEPQPRAAVPQDKAQKPTEQLGFTDYWKL